MSTIIIHTLLEFSINYFFKIINKFLETNIPYTSVDK